MLEALRSDAPARAVVTLAFKRSKEARKGQLKKSLEKYCDMLVSSN